MPPSEELAVASFRNNEPAAKTVTGQDIFDGRSLTRRSIAARVSAVSRSKVASDFVFRAAKAAQIPISEDIKAADDLFDPKKRSFATPTQAAGRSMSSISFVALQEWEGFVEDFNEEVVYARLKSVRDNSEYETHIAEIPLIEFSDSDKMRLERGSIFRWAIGLQKRGSTSSRVSSIVLRHLPAWTKKEIAEAKRVGKSLSERLKQAQNGDPSPARRD